MEITSNESFGGAEVWDSTGKAANIPAVISNVSLPGIFIPFAGCSLRPQATRRINTGSEPCWEIGSGKRNGDQAGSDYRVRGEIGRCYSKKETRNQPSGCNCRDTADQHTCYRKIETLTQDEPEHLARSGANRDPDSQLACALADGPRNDSVESDQNQKHRGTSEG